MLRLLCLGLMLGLSVPAWGPAAAQTGMASERHVRVADIVWDVMRLDNLASVMREEAVAEASAMAATMFPRGGTGQWLDQVAAINDPARIRTLFVDGMARAMATADPDAVQQGLAFYRTVFGQRLLVLEAEARRAMQDAGADARAREAFGQALGRRDPRAARIVRLVRAADLIEPNVAGNLNATIAFSRGFAAGGGFPAPPSDIEITQNAWAQEPRVRAETEAWIGAYLFLAYGVLGDAELDRYIAYAGSTGGQTLSRLMFAGFDAVLSVTSRDMGRAAAIELRGRAL